MKIFYLLFGVLCAIVAAQANEMPEEIVKALEECGKEFGLSKDTFGKAMDNNDPKVKCFHACIIKKEGVLVDGKVSIDKKLEVLSKHIPGGPPEHVKEALTECAKKANEEKDECDVAATLAQCMFEKFGPSKKE